MPDPNPHPRKLNEAGLPIGLGLATTEAGIPVTPVVALPPAPILPYTINMVGLPIARVPWLNSAGWPPVS